MLKLINKIEELLNEKEYVVIAIDGKSGSGKTTLSKFLKDYYQASVISIDDFYLPFEKRNPQRLKEIAGHMDYERFKKEVIDNLDSNFTYLKYSCNLKEYTDLVNIERKRLTIIEGTYSLLPYFGRYYDLSVFMNINKEKQLERILNRVGQERINDFINKWFVYEDHYFNFYKIKDNVDIYI